MTVLLGCALILLVGLGVLALLVKRAVYNDDPTEWREWHD